MATDQVQQGPKVHKRKRSIQDAPIDKIQSAMHHIAALKKELAGIEETEVEVEAMMEHVSALEGILRGAKKPVCGFTGL